MLEVESSILFNDLADAEHIRPSPAAFEKQAHIKATLTPILWSEGRLFLANTALLCGLFQRRTSTR